MNTKLANLVTPYADTIDSRDVIELIGELEGEIEALNEERDELTSNEVTLSDADNDRVDEIDEELKELQEQLEPLVSLADEASSSPDWEYGETLISDSYFKEYARELAEDIDAIPKNAPWPICFVDWDAASEALKMDYTSVDFAGETFWIRS
jgi:DNA repair exonuclease SbcCD ATPase subunit